MQEEYGQRRRHIHPGELEVVDDEHDRWLRPGVQGVEQSIHDTVDPARPVQPGQGLPRAAGGELLEGGDGTGPELGRVLVRFLEGEPAGVGPPLRRPAGQKRRLAHAGGGHDKGQRELDRLIEQLQQAGPPHVVVGDDWNPDLGLEQRRSRGSRWWFAIRSARVAHSISPLAGGSACTERTGGTSSVFGLFSITLFHHPRRVAPGRDHPAPGGAAHPATTERRRRSTIHDA